MIFPDLDYELNGDTTVQVREIERQNREETAQAVLARDLIARVVANHRARARENHLIGRRNAGPRKPPKTYAKRKPRVKVEPAPRAPLVEGHWAELLLEYVRRDGEIEGGKG